MNADLTAPIFTNEDKAREHFEALRWPQGRVCPHCGTVGNSTLMQGATTRPGLYKCKDCRKPFTATMGTVYEKSHIPLHKWLLATHLLCSSKKGMSAHQLYRMLGFGSYRTAWFMAHRIREAMRPEGGEPMGGGGGPVEVDETFIGHDILTPPKPGAKMGIANMNKVLSLVDRSTGEARSFVVKDLRMATITPIIEARRVPLDLPAAWLAPDFPPEEPPAVGAASGLGLRTERSLNPRINVSRAALSRTVLNVKSGCAIAVMSSRSNLRPAISSPFSNLTVLAVRSISTPNASVIAGEFRTRSTVVALALTTAATSPNSSVPSSRKSSTISERRTRPPAPANALSIARDRQRCRPTPDAELM